MFKLTRGSFVALPLGSLLIPLGATCLSLSPSSAFETTAFLRSNTWVSALRIQAGRLLTFIVESHAVLPDASYLSHITIETSHHPHITFDVTNSHHPCDLASRGQVTADDLAFFEIAGCRTRRSGSRSKQ